MLLLETLLGRWGYTFNMRQGGASYNSYGITAGTSGFYFVFGQLQLDPQSSGQRCGFKLEIGSKILSRVYIVSSGGATYDRTEYTGLVVKMSSGERLQMTSAHSCTFVNHFNVGSFIGAFYLPFQTEPAVHLLSSSSGWGILSRGIRNRAHHASNHYSFTLGATLKTWSSATINIGNVLYSPSGFTVPKSGIYYVYVQLELDPYQTPHKNCGYELRTERKIIAAAHYWRPNPSGKDRVTYTGAAARLSSGDAVSVRIKGTCNLERDFNQESSFLGGFYLRSY